jgi:serine/threonine-protein kinase
MGTVHRARRLADGKPAAIKWIRPTVELEPDVAGRFQREVAILGRLRHPKIVRILESGAASGALWFAMELVDGESATDLIRRAGPLPTKRVIEIGLDILEALSHAHELGYVHRDVKPSNVLLTRSGEAKLADFGLARAYQASVLSGLTASGSTGGTPEFMPPEQVLDFRSAQPAADLYATAATLFALSECRPIYEPAPTPLGLLWRILTLEPIPLRPPPMPGPFGEVLRTALSRDPANRYPDASAMRAALASVM